MHGQHNYVKETWMTPVTSLHGLVFEKVEAKNCVCNLYRVFDVAVHHLKGPKDIGKKFCRHLCMCTCRPVHGTVGGMWQRIPRHDHLKI